MGICLPLSQGSPCYWRRPASGSVEDTELVENTGRLTHLYYKEYLQVGSAGVKESSPAPIPQQ